MEQVETKVDVVASRIVGRNEASTDISEHPVDVLAVLDDVIDHAMNKPYRNCGSLCGLRLEDSRAAIAELIACAGRSVEILERVDDAAACGNAQRLRAALARVGGGK